MTQGPGARDSRTLLVVDDDGPLRTRLVRAFTDRGFSVTQAANFDEAMAIATEESPEMALVDLRLPGRSGIDVVRRLKELDDTTNVVVLTGYGSIATAVESIRLGATTYLTKPVDADQILAAFAGTNSAQRDVSSGTSQAAPVATPSLARVEWEHIQRVMTDCRGNVSLAARQLRMHRRSLQRKLSKYPVSEEC